MRNRARFRLGIVVLALLVAAGVWLLWDSPPPGPGASSPAFADAPRSPAPSRVARDPEDPGTRTLSIVDDTTGVPIRNAGVKRTGSRSALLWASAQGELDWSVHGPVRVTVSAPGYVPRHITIVPALEQIRLRPGGHTVSGVVEDLYGGVVSGAVVEASSGAVARSDDAGLYRISMPAGAWRITARGEDYFPQTRAVYLAAETAVAGVDFDLVPGGAIEGIVVDDAGEAIPTASVNYTVFTPRANGYAHSPASQARRVQADDLGRFRIGPLAPANYQLLAHTSRASTPAPTPVHLRLLETKDGIRLVLRPGSEQAGRVEDDEGAPVPGVAVTARHRAGHLLEAVTDDEGRFVIAGLHPGEWSFHATSSGGLVSPGVDRLIADDSADTAPIELELARGGRIEGTLSPGAEAGVTLQLPGPAVSFEDFGRSKAVRDLRVVADADGSFTIEDAPPGTWSVRARADDGREGVATVDLEPGGRIVTQIELAPGGAIQGTLENRGGSLDDLQIRVGARTEFTRVPVEDAGTFAVPQLPVGSWRIDVLQHGTPIPLAEGPSKLTVESGTATSVALVVDSPSARIGGRVLDVDAGPVGDALVELRAPKGETLRAVTDGDGAFSVEVAGAAQYDVSVTGPSGLGLAAAEDVGADEDLELVLGAPSRLRGRVTHRGSPVARFSVRPPRSPAFPVFVGNPSGAFELHDLQPGTVWISVLADQGVARRSVELRAGQASEVELELQAWGSAHGTVLDAQGQPVRGATVVVSSEAGRKEGAGPAKTDGDGRFTIGGLGPGSTVFNVSHGDATTRTEKTLVEPADDLDLGTLRLAL